MDNLTSSYTDKQRKDMMTSNFPIEGKSKKGPSKPKKVIDKIRLNIQSVPSGNQRESMHENMNEEEISLYEIELMTAAEKEQVQVFSKTLSLFFSRFVNEEYVLRLTLFGVSIKSIWIVRKSVS